MRQGGVPGRRGSTRVYFQTDGPHRVGSTPRRRRRPAGRRSSTTRWSDLMQAAVCSVPGSRRRSLPVSSPPGLNPGNIKALGAGFLPGVPELRDRVLGDGLVPHVPLLAGGVQSAAVRSERLLHASRAACANVSPSSSASPRSRSTPWRIAARWRRRRWRSSRAPVTSYPIGDQEFMCRHGEPHDQQMGRRLPARARGGLTDGRQRCYPPSSPISNRGSRGGASTASPSATPSG